APSSEASVVAKIDIRGKSRRELGIMPVKNPRMRHDRTTFHDERRAHAAGSRGNEPAWIGPMGRQIGRNIFLLTLRDCSVRSVDNRRRHGYRCIAGELANG